MTRFVVCRLRIAAIGSFIGARLTEVLERAVSATSTAGRTGLLFLWGASGGLE